MVTFDEIGVMLDDIADALPDDLFTELNGGIVLLPDTMIHPDSDQEDNLFILGEYHEDPMGLGRYITIYYGSFIEVYGQESPEQQMEMLKEILYHEFRHHLESMAGDQELDIKDAIELAEYKQSIKHNN